MFINVTVRDLGIYDETFNTTIYANFVRYNDQKRQFRVGKRTRCGADFPVELL